VKHDHRAAPDVPDEAHVVFGDRLQLAQIYADLLAGDGVTRGLLGPREVDRIWDRHLLNCAAVESCVPEQADCLDVGSGAGLPGIPLALARPDVSVRLVEPLLRRVNFLELVVDALGLDRVSVTRARAEALPAASADVVLARAVAPLERLVRWTLPLLTPGGRLVAMKGERAAEELASAEPVLRRLGAAGWEVSDLALPSGAVATRAVVVVAGNPSRRR
jgi:16S rRNA (guanine527-N7)-methyltransferase